MANLNLNYYKGILPIIPVIITNNSTRNDSEIVGLVSASTGVHIVVCAYYLCYIKGHRDALSGIVEKLKAFYKIDEVDGLEDFFNDDGTKKEITSVHPTIQPSNGRRVL